jgi:AAA15 family ATPase/GTPase
MLKTIKIENFRSFQSFELQQLGRVNLLVGKNNTGKTSILEAIQILCSRANLEPMSEVMINRGEYFWSYNPTEKEERELDICHLYHTHKLQSGSKFTISGINENIEEKIVVAIGKHKLRLYDDSSQAYMQENSDLDISLTDIEGLTLQVNWIHGDKTKEIIAIPLSENNGLPLKYVHRSSQNTNLAPRNILVTSSSLTTAKMTDLFEKVVLTPDEKVIEEALNIIDDRIERIASVNIQNISPLRVRNTFDSRGGFFVLLSDSNQRVPIGSMGDGIWRMLGLALATVCAKNGYLFVDEIDTGLHFTAMSDMWRMIWETAKRLNVQVFATTHNSDCWMSLASVVQQEDAAEDGIRIHRIEKGKEKSVVFTEPQIAIAAEREIEVR